MSASTCFIEGLGKGGTRGMDAVVITEKITLEWSK